LGPVDSTVCIDDLNALSNVSNSDILLESSFLIRILNVLATVYKDEYVSILYL